MRLLPFDYAARNLGRNPLRTALGVGGAALVVLLVALSAGFVRGMSQSLISSGSPHNVLLLGAGSEESVERSQLPFKSAAIAAASLQGVRTRHGEPYLSPEVHLGLSVTRAADAPQGRLTVVRGVTPRAFLVHAAVEVVEGRPPRAGSDELLVGARLAEELGLAPGACLGTKLWLDGRAWTVVGRFVAPGTVLEAELWTALTDLQVVAQRDTLSCVVLTLDPTQAELADVEAFAAQRLDLELVAVSEQAYYSGLEAFFRPIRLMVLLTAALIACGGVLGGLNVSYALFASRSAELGTLQVLGYGRGAVLVALLQESLLGHALGALCACALALPLFDDLSVRTSMGSFGLRLDAPVLALALGAGLALGCLGILPAALRLFTTPLPASLRQ